MKKLFFLFIYSVCFLSLYAQEYNIRGDEAMKREDYREAQSWYSEGLDSCDRYSINRLTEIWRKQPELRRSMRLPMQKCYACLQTFAENEDTEAMFLILTYFKESIVKPDSIQADFWMNKLGLNTQPDSVNMQTVDIIKTPKKMKTRKYRFFLSYTYSPTMPVGFTVGTYNKFGLYFTYKNDLQPVNSVYDCDNEKVFGIDIENPPYRFSKEKWHSCLITGGFLIPLMEKKLLLSAGGGYGFRDYYREITTTAKQPFYATGKPTAWVHNTEASYEGFTLEVGGLWSYKHLIVTGGVNTTLFNDLDAYIGVGFSF
jgi:hypothetical protein